MNEQLTEWGQQLSQILHAQLEAGSASAVFVVFAAGLLTSLTPCVYPMIPVTVTYIGGASAGSRPRAVTLSVVYVLGLSLVYATLGVIAATAGMTFGNFTRTPWVFGAVGLLIAVFGVAMLGWIDIPVPGFFGRVQSEGAQRGGHVGALMMGMAAGFVAAPCTAPVLGLLLSYVALSSSQEGAGIGAVVWGAWLLLVFALGLGFLLMMLGIFSGLLSNLPRAGAWMDRVKKVFGVGMLAIAAWFFWQAVHIAINS